MGVIVHELLHALGFYHMQSSRDRDNYVTIFRQNIIKNEEINFYKYFDTHHYGQKYDYESIMHYPPDAFSVNGQATLLPIVSNLSNRRKRILKQ